MKLSVLMPVYNESRTLRAIVERVLQAPIDIEIELVCVDDSSTDDSLEILHDLAHSDSRIKVHFQPVNLRKGRIKPFASRLFDLLVPGLKRLDGVLPGEGADLAGSRSRAMS